MLQPLPQTQLTLTFNPAAMVFCGFIWMPSTMSSSYVEVLLPAPFQLPAPAAAAACWSGACGTPLLLKPPAWLGCTPDDSTTQVSGGTWYGEGQEGVIQCQ